MRSTDDTLHINFRREIKQLDSFDIKMFIGRRYLRDLSHYDGEMPDMSTPNETPLSPNDSFSPEHRISAARVLTQPLKWRGANETSKVINEKISL